MSFIFALMCSRRGYTPPPAIRYNPPMSDYQNRNYLSVGEVSAYTGLTVRAIHRMVGSGEIAAFKSAGGQYRFRLQDIRGAAPPRKKKRRPARHHRCRQRHPTNHHSARFALHERIGE